MPAQNIGWGSITSVNNDAVVVRENASKEPFDDFMRLVTEHLNTMPMVKKLGRIEYTVTSVDAGMMISPAIPPRLDPPTQQSTSPQPSHPSHPSTQQSTSPPQPSSKTTLENLSVDQKRMASDLLATDADTPARVEMEKLVAEIESSAPPTVNRSDKMAAIRLLDGSSGSDVEGAARLLLNIYNKDIPSAIQKGLLRRANEALLHPIQTTAASGGGAKVRKQARQRRRMEGGEGGEGADEPTWSSVTDDVDKRIADTTDPSLKSKKTLLEAYRLVVARDMLKARQDKDTPVIKGMMRELSRAPFPVPAEGNDYFVGLVETSYANNVTRIAVAANAGGNSQDGAKMDSKMLELSVNGTKWPLLWLGDVARNLMASIEVAWTAIDTTERRVALEQYVVGRVCQYLAEDWTWNESTKKFTSVNANTAPRYFVGGALGWRSFQVFNDMYGDRSRSILDNQTKPFEDLCKSIKRAVGNSGGLFSLEITQGKKAVARVLPFVPKKRGVSELDAAREYLRRRRCCEGDARKRMLENGQDVGDSKAQSPEMTLNFGRYDPSYASIVVMVFLFYVSGMANQITYPQTARETGKVPKITQSMLSSILGGFDQSKARANATPLKTPTYRGI